MADLTPSDITILANVSDACVRTEREACVRDVCAWCAADLSLDLVDMTHPRFERNGEVGKRRVKCRAAAIHQRARAEDESFKQQETA